MDDEDELYEVFAEETWFEKALGRTLTLKSTKAFFEKKLPEKGGKITASTSTRLFDRIVKDYTAAVTEAAKVFCFFG